MTEKDIIVIGDRVLIKLDDGEKRTEVGLYLPQSVQDKEEVLGGEIVRRGKGVPMVDPTAIIKSPWSNSEVSVRYMPMEAKVGDYALFLRKAAIELQLEGEFYHLVPQSAILILLREPGQEEDEIN